MNRAKPVILLLPACFLLALLLLVPAAPESSASRAAEKSHVPPGLVGTWHTESIDGDCLFLIIREFRVTLHEDNRFLATVRLRDDSTESMSGTFQVLPDKTLAFQAKDKSQHTRIHYRLEDKGQKLKVKDPKFGVTVEMKKLPVSSGK